MARPRGTGKPVQLGAKSSANVVDFVRRYRLQATITRYASETQPATRMANWTPEFRAMVIARSDELDAVDKLVRQRPGGRPVRTTPPRGPRTSRSQPIARPFETRNVGPADVDWQIVAH